MAKGARNLESFTEDLGRLLGTVQAKAQGWLNQRRTVAKQLTEIRDTASRLLTQLGQESGLALKRGRAAYIAVSDGSASATKKKRRRMSRSARAKISAAQKARWAKVKAATAKK